MTTIVTAPKLLLTAQEAADVLAISLREIRRLVKAGELEPRYIGNGRREYRITYASVVEYFDSLSTEARAS